jgi:thiol-disulfide isomerase/thioredoxin
MKPPLDSIVRSSVRIFSIACISLSVVATLGAAVRVGDSFPALESLTPSGTTRPQTSGKVMLVDFWASWCAPCKASFPSYSRLNSEFSSKGLVIVAVSVDQDPVAYASFIRRFAPPFFIMADTDQSLVRAVQVPTMPTSYLIDREGRVRFVHAGFHGAETEQELRSEIGMLLSGTSR